MDIDIIINKLEHVYYTSLNTTLIKNNAEIEWLTTYINKLNGVIDSETLTTKQNEPILSDQSNDDNNLYKKSWSKLNAIHKIIKIK